MLNELRMLNIYLVRYFMLNKLGIKLEGKSIGFKKVLGIRGWDYFLVRGCILEGLFLFFFR